MSEITNNQSLVEGTIVKATVTGRNQHGIMLAAGESKAFLPKGSDERFANLKKGDEVEVVAVETGAGQTQRVRLCDQQTPAAESDNAAASSETESAGQFDLTKPAEGETEFGRKLREALLKSGKTSMPAVAPEPVKTVAPVETSPAVEQTVAGDTVASESTVSETVAETADEPAVTSETESETESEPETQPAMTQREKVLALKGRIVEGTVRKALPYGVIVQLPETTALLHVSQIPGDRAAREQALAALKEGTAVKAVVREVEEETLKVKLSLTMLERVERIAQLKEGDVVVGTVKRLEPYGALVQLDGFTGLLHVSHVPGHNHAAKQAGLKELAAGTAVTATVIEVDAAATRVGLSLRPQARAQFLAGNHEGVSFLGTVVGVREYGVLVNIGAVVGLLHVSQMPGNREERDSFLAELKNGTELTVTVESIDRDKERVALSMR